MKKEKEILLTIFKSKMFYVSIVLLIVLFLLDAFHVIV